MRTFLHAIVAALLLATWVGLTVFVHRGLMRMSVPPPPDMEWLVAALGGAACEAGFFAVLACAWMLAGEILDWIDKQ
jgi:hypothetical protein